MMAHVRVLLTILLTTVAIVGCAKTTITSIVSPAAPQYGAGQILVVAAYSDLGWRADVEEGFQARHPAFVPSVGVLDIDALNDPEAIRARIASDSIIEAILVIGPEGAGLSESFLATEYYVGTVAKPWANTSATLFDVIDEKTVWQAGASTEGSGFSSWSNVRSSFIGRIVAQLRSDGLLTTDRPEPRRRPPTPVAVAVSKVNWSRPLPAPSEVITIGSDDSNPATGPQSLYERVAMAVVRVEGDRGLGTAFVITRDGLALTNHHVISGQSRLVARFGDNRTAPIRVMRSNEDSDVALIQIHCKRDCFTVSLGSERDISMGSDIYAIGHPAGLTASLTQGIVSGLRRAGSVTLIQVDAALNTGNSGGPIIDIGSGKAVAIVSFKLSQSEGLGFGVAIDDALRVLGVRVR